MVCDMPLGDAGINHTLKKWTPLMALLFLLAVCFALWLALDPAPSVPIPSECGVWDLREFDFSDPKAIAKLTGQVAYIPNALLTPEEFEDLKHETVYGYPEDTAQYATSRMRVLVPDGYYAFSSLSVDFSERLYVNGHLVFEIGSPGESKETTVPDTRSQILTLTPEDGVIEIVVQSSNFVHREGGGHAGWKVGNPETLLSYMKSGYLTNMEMGCYLALFLVHLILFLILRTFRANLLFALSCLMWFLRSGVTWTKVFSVILPSMSWFVKFRIEYLSFPVTAILFVGLVHTLFPGVLQKWFLYAMAAAMSVFSAIFLFADTVFMSWAILWCEGVFVAVMLYMVARFAMKLRRVSPEQLIFLVGAALFLYAAANDMLDHNNVSSFFLFPFVSRDLSQISLMIFAFFEATAIFIATARGIEEAKEAEQRLASRVQMTENLLALQREQYARLTENAARVEAARHDLRHQLAVIRRYNEAGKPGKLGEYIDELVGSMPAPETAWCENYAVNAIISQHLSAASEDISLDIRLEIPEDTGQVPDWDLCVIIGNFLENAVEACRRMEVGKKFIRARSRVQGDYLSLFVENSFDGQWSEQNGAYLSRKRGNAGDAAREGVGLSSVKAVCAGYNGFAKFEAGGNVWRSSALVSMENGSDAKASGEAVSF